jgi:GntR family transcriptional regulator
MDMSGGQAPFYMQLREIVRYKIETGEYAPCTALPSENELADTFSTTRQTAGPES